jgi:protein required for attachment to host cells
MPHLPRTWIIAADDAAAHIFEREDGHLKPVSDMTAHEDAETELGNRTVGRTGSSATERHKYEPTMTESRQHELLFAHQIAAVLNDAAARRAFEKLVVVAAPKMLGYLREYMDDTARKYVATEVNKELANLPSRELQERLLDILHDPDIMSGSNRHPH